MDGYLHQRQQRISACGHDSVATVGNEQAEATQAPNATNDKMSACNFFQRDQVSGMRFWCIVQDHNQGKQIASAFEQGYHILSCE